MNAENMFRDTNMWTQAGDGEKYHAQTMRSNYETFKAPAIDPPTPPASLTARSVRRTHRPHSWLTSDAKYLHTSLPACVSVSPVRYRLL